MILVHVVSPPERQMEMVATGHTVLWTHSDPVVHTHAHVAGPYALCLTMHTICHNVAAPE